MKTINKMLIALGVLYLLSCGNGGSFKDTDTHSRGKVEIYFEESFKPLFDTAIHTFEGQFPSADIVPKYSSETEVIKAFFKQKTKTILITRDFTPKEKSDLKKSKIEVRSCIIATDAVALIIHPSNLDSVMTIPELKAILKGEKTTWEETKKPINVVFDNENSANFNYLHNLVNQSKLAKNVYAVNSNEEVIKYVQNNPSAIGVIGLNWISDTDDTQTQNFLKGIRVIHLAKQKGDYAYPPVQAYVYTKEYPLTRDVWFINMGSRSGLNSGFVNYMQQEQGQLMIHKASLITRNAPMRLIGFETE